MLASLRNPTFKRLALPWLLIPPSPVSKLYPTSWKSKDNLCFRRIFAGISTSSKTSSEYYTDASSSPYLSVHIRCRKHVSDMFSEALMCFGASSVSMDDPNSCENSDEICISSIFTECQDVRTCISRAANSIGLKEMPNYEVIMDEQCDWIRKTQESFHPVEITEGLWIVPEWRSPPDLRAINIILNPGLTFGTGEHPTTKLCLLLLHGLVKGGEFFLDYGTGSGILGIAALKLGAALSVGIDIDPEAITSARQNATLNNIEPQKMQVCLVPSKANPPVYGRTFGDEPQNPNGIAVVAETEKYDIVIANILLNPLLELAGHIVAYAKPGGVIGVSGIISEQLPQIEECYSQYLEGISVSEMEGWACVSGTKKRNLKCN